MSNRAKPNAVIFDWDETLAQTRDLVVTSMQSTLDHYKLGSWDKIKKEKRDTSKSLKENFGNFFGAAAAEAYDLYLKSYRENFQGGLLATPAAEETLEYLQNLSVSLFIISNKEKSLLQDEVKYLFPGIKFNRILGNGDAEYNKPHPAPVYAALRDTGIDLARDEVWLVGDSRQDTDCALAAGCLPILIGEGKFIGEDYWNETAQAKKICVFDSFEGLLSCIKTTPSLKNRQLLSSTLAAR